MDILPCPLCESLTLPNLKPCEPSIYHRFRKMVFHDSCKTCDSEENRALQVCEVCKHLRLQHLASCSLSWFEDDDRGPFPETLENIQDTILKLHVSANTGTSLPQVEIRLGTFGELKSRLSCKLCSDVTKLLIFRCQSPEFNENSWDQYFVTVITILKHPGLYIKVEHATNDWLNSTIEFASFHSPYAKQTDPVKSLSREPINWNQINGWIEESQTRDDLKPKGSLILPKEFRVIDVERDKVILAPDHCEFVALSYVWGETSNDLMLCGSNVQQLVEDFSISRIDLPATIKDAMIACAKIGKRYLWVDRLCIVQDGGDKIKQAQIERMGDIYSSAFLTIVGACGDDARSGLAGVNGKPRLRAPWVISLNDMILIEAVDTSFRGELEAIPKWHTRGWTYQEFALSFKSLIFTEFGLCYMSNPREVSNTGNMKAFEFPPNCFSCLQPYHAKIKDIRYMIEQYTKRYLTYDNDIIRAFSGILNQFGSRHQSGMPLENFDDNLFWRPLSWKQASRTPKSSGAIFFPSWSWSSVIGPVTFDYFFYHVPVTTWAYISPKEGNVDMLSRGMQSYGWHQLAHKEGFYNLEHLIDLRDCRCNNYFDTECCEDCCRNSHTHVQMNMEKKVSIFRKKFSDEDINAAAVPGRLLLLTQTARLRLELFDTIAEASSTEFSLWNEDGQWTGIIQLSEYNSQLVIQMFKNSNMAFFDFAAISICHLWEGPQPLRRFFDNSKRFGLLEKAPLAREDELKFFCGSREKFFQGVRYEGYDSIRRLAYELPVLNVMLLLRRGNVAHRVGCGQVWVRKWVQSKPRINPIVLE